MSPLSDLDDLSPAELKGLVIALLTKVGELERTVAGLRDEIAHLKNVPVRPTIKRTGMEQATQANSSGGAGKPCRGGGRKTAQRVIHEDRMITVPDGSRFKGYEDFVVQDLVLRPLVVRYRRERWLTPDGTTVTASLPTWQAHLDRLADQSLIACARLVLGTRQTSGVKTGYLHRHA